MSRTSFRTVSALALGLGAAATLSVPGIAAAQTSIPGDAVNSTVVRVMPHLATVTVNDAPQNATSVSGRFTNLTGASLTCQGHPGNTGASGTVAPAGIAQASLEYYKNFPIRPEFNIDQGITVAGSTIALKADLGAIPTLLPGGSAAPAFGPNYATRSAIAEKFAEAKVKGQTGQVPTFSVGNGAGHNWSAPLGTPASGSREDFQAGVIFVCTGSNAVWAFAGYEGGTEPERDPRGILQSGSLGRF